MQKNFVRKPLETVKMYRCQHCGGSLKFGPDDIIYTCPYCSYTAIIDGLTIKDHHYCPSITPEAAQERVREFLHACAHAQFGYIPPDLAEKTEIMESRIVYIPFWRVPIEAETKYRGQIVLEIKGKSGKRYIPISRKISDRKDVYILARRFASFYGLEELKERLGRPVSWQTVNLAQAKKERETFLNAEISEEEAYIAAKNSIEDTHRSQAEKGVAIPNTLFHYWLKRANKKKDQDLLDIFREDDVASALSKKKAKVKASELFDCLTTAKTKRATYLHVPLFIVRYRYKDKLYKVALDGTDGIVLKAELPLALLGRLGHLVLAFFSVIGAGVVAETGFHLFLLYISSGEAELEGLLAVGGIFVILTLILLYAAFRFFNKIFQAQHEYQRR